MSLDAILASIVSNQEKIIALLSNGAPAAAGTTTKTTTTKGTTKGKPSVTKSQVTAAVTKVKEALGAPATRELLAANGVAKLVEITEDKYDAVYAAANAALEAQNSSSEDEDEI